MNMVFGALLLFLLGFPYAVLSMYYDDRPFPRYMRIFSGVLVAILIVMFAQSVTMFAVDKYDMCKDPAYVGTAWWYAWGCWMY